MTYGLTYKTKEGRNLAREEVEACVQAIKDIIKSNNKLVQIEFKGKVSYNKYNINFNGIGKKGYETFIFYSKFKVNPAEEIVEALEQNEANNFSDVITAGGQLKSCRITTLKKPYDKIVKQALMKCQEITDNAFDIVCDNHLGYFKDKISEDKKEFKTLEQVGKKYKYDWSSGGK